MSDDNVLRAAFEETLANMGATEFNALVSRVRQPTDAASVRASLAAKSADLLALPTDRNGAVGAWHAVVDAAAARQPAPAPQPPAAVVELPQRGGYVGSASLRRMPFTPPAPTK